MDLNDCKDFESKRAALHFSFPGFVMTETC